MGGIYLAQGREQRRSLANVVENLRFLYKEEICRVDKKLLLPSKDSASWTLLQTLQHEGTQLISQRGKFLNT
jgi:hypothetical protein